MRYNCPINDNFSGSDDYPLVTIITSVLNKVDTIEATISSVSNQKYNNIEYIVIDGGSTDGTVDLLNRRSSEINYWISEPDAGIYDAWNKGFQMANGTWLAFIGADDVLMPNAIQNMIDLLQNSLTPVDLVSGKARVIYKNGKVQVVGCAWNWALFRHHCVIAHSGAILNKSYFNRFGLFSREYKIAGDYELLLRAGSKLNALFIDDVVVNMEADGVSSNTGRVFFETMRAQLLHKVDYSWRIYLYSIWAYAKWILKKIIKLMVTQYNEAATHRT